MTAGRWAIWAWAVGGVVLIMVQAVIRLTPLALGVLEEPLTPLHWVLVAVWTVFMLYSEAWRGFHKQFSPRVVVRALGIANDPVPWRVVFAPIVAMGLMHGTRRRLIISRTLLVGVIVLILCVRMLPPPWRSIIDVGVVIGLLAGTASLVWFAVQAVAGRPPAVPAEFPQ